MASTEVLSLSVDLECRCLLRVPDEPDPNAFIFALHGYGMDAETMLRLAATWFPDYAIASLQAPHHFYRDMGAREVGYSWATHAQSEQSVRVHHELVLQAFEACGAAAAKRLLLGFSQPVGLNYRFAASYPAAVRGVIGVCGGVPKDWETGAYQPVQAALLHIARTEDEIYPPDVTRLYPERLRLRAPDVEFLEFAGGHRFPSLAQPAVRDWVRRKFEPSPQP